MPVGQYVLNTNYKHSNMNVKIDTNLMTTIVIVFTIKLKMKWREDHTKSATYKLCSQSKNDSK